MKVNSHALPSSIKKETTAIENSSSPFNTMPSRLKVGVKSVAINAFLNPKREEEKKNDIEIDTPKKEFSEAELLAVWVEYAEQIKSKDLDIYTTLTKNLPKISEKNVLTFKLLNKAQEHDLQEIKNDLLFFLRTKLNNFNITLNTLLEKGAEEKGLYTPSDKFKKLVQKNPILNELRKRLDLDLQ